ncbi:hypothetical protein EJ05DRAFT_509012 [Pseudovirgaria hyperparasitica]|uniref:Peroxisome membrane anchor protein Pex14p N-terminal domain-containing protein n=1 Tax=Pseudovirgaria hyperparasitica TaxID=470096 RepID=A0A6A6WCC0_9PEZI|nr:uncharacterized protein EJ05DRAFT_509012 [Pseudovirgaria hyperparasitica]KAF2760482.1 hypothetical protein EJ05DRAFT_509012 [Pseudovirgaria hyperparasitica]
MPEPKKPSIPSWQLLHKKDSPSSPEPSTEDPTSTSTTTTAIDSETGVDTTSSSSSDANANADTDTSADVEQVPSLEAAEKLLRDEGSLRDASVEEKRGFLQSKGVKKGDVARVLGGEDGGEEVQVEGKVVLDTSLEGSTLQPRSQSATTTSTLQPSVPQAPVSQPQLPAAPPIVTYPEFLTQPTDKAPLVTVSRLVNTTYIAGGIAATIYGLSKFLVTPMVDSLTVARHDFASNTQTRLNELNEKLAGMVSVDPASKRPRSVISEATTPATDSDDAESIDSDPTELYHRDYGTQTSPHISRRPSTTHEEDHASTDIDTPPPPASAAEKVPTGHSARLKIMTSHMRDLQTASETNDRTADSLKKELRALDDYLTAMRFQTPRSAYDSDFANVYHASRGLGVGGGGGASERDSKEDAVEDVRASIRGVKGVLLAARNFPAGLRK